MGGSGAALEDGWVLGTLRQMDHFVAAAFPGPGGEGMGGPAPGAQCPGHLKEAAHCFSFVLDPTVPNVVVTKLTLVCASAPGPLELDLTGE